MERECQQAAQSCIRSFVERALPDAPRELEVRPRTHLSGRAWHVEAEIPTSALPCWLSFDLLQEGEAVVASGFSAMRSGRKSDEENVYVWDDAKGAWQLATDRPDSA